MNMVTSEMKNEENESLGIAGRISRVFLKNTELSILTIIMLAVWGTVSFALTPKQYNPEIVAPAFIIATDFPGASAEETYELVTRPIEDAVFELPDIDDVASRSFPGGKSIVTVKFLIGSDRENAKIALNQKLRDHAQQKAAGVGEPMVQSIDPDDVPILDIGLSSKTASESSLRKLAFDIADELKRIEGISKVDIRGGRTRTLEASLNAQKLAALNLTINEVVTALQTQNNLFTFNTLKQDSFDPTIHISGNIKDIEDFSGIVIRNASDGIVRLGDIATVAYGTGDIENYSRHTTSDKTPAPTVHIALSKLKGENSTAVSAATLEKLDSLRGNLIPQDISATVLNDEGATASEEIGKLTFDLIKSIAIVGILLAIFLGTRNAIIASISIPLVLLAVFGVGLLFEQTINRITLFALILSLGLLVDDAIVVVENIARYSRLYPNENKIKLIARAVDEVGGALALSTFTMAIAFIPMAFVTGMMGPYMGPIPFFVPTALFASLIFAVTINPFLALLFDRKKKQETLSQSHSYESRRLFRAIKRVEKSYANFLASLLRQQKRRRIFLGSIALALLLSIILPLSPIVPFRMLPKADKDQFSLYVDLPNGTDIETTNALSKEFETLILKESSVESVDSFIGMAPIVDFNGLFKGSESRIASNQATFKIHLTPHSERNITSEEIASSLRAHLNTIERQHPNAVIQIVEDPPGPPVLATLLLKVKGPDERILEHIALDMKQELGNTQGVVDIDTSLSEHGKHWVYRIDREKANLLTLAPNEIASTIQTALNGSAIGLYHQSEQSSMRKAEQEYITIRFAPEYRNETSDLSLIRVIAKDGTSIPLSEILVPTEETIDTVISSDNREKTVFLSAEMEGRGVIYAVIDLFPKMLRYTLPNENSERVSWSPTHITYRDTISHREYTIEIDGEWKLTLEVFRDLGIAMGLAILLIYFILAAKTGSIFVPLIIMTSIPLSLIGILPGFALLHFTRDTYFNATSMIGVIALAGLAVKNAVIYLEYLEPLKRSGMPITEALVEAGRIRLLPILLTSLAAILGSFTIVSDPVWEGLAWSIIFGLSASTVLTLLVFPTLFFVFERKHWQEK